VEVASWLFEGVRLDEAKLQCPPANLRKKNFHFSLVSRFLYRSKSSFEAPVSRHFAFRGVIVVHSKVLESRDMQNMPLYWATSSEKVVYRKRLCSVSHVSCADHVTGCFSPIAWPFIAKRSDVIFRLADALKSCTAKQRWESWACFTRKSSPTSTWRHR